MAAVTLDKHDLQQASQLQEQLRKAIQDQQQLSTSLQGEWQKQEQKLSTRYSTHCGLWLHAPYSTCKATSAG